MIFIMSLITSLAMGQTLNNEAITITWPFDTAEDGQTATFSGDMGQYIKSNYVTLGSNLFFSEPRTYDDITFSRIEPVTSIGKSTTNDPTNDVKFTFKPKTGLTFTPTKVSFDANRQGTSGGYLDISWFSSDGKEISLATGQNPNRENETPAHSEYSYTISGASASDGECGLRINIYNLDITKGVGLANIVIEGTLSGESTAVEYTLTVNVSPEGAGVVTTSPVGTVFDEDEVVTLSQERGFGYEFVSWTDASGSVISTNKSCDITMTEDKTITANYNAIDIYALTVNLNSGARDYMISYSPEPEVIDGKNMYETGTNVTLSASSNQILTFTSWSTGETSNDITIKMDGDQTVDANYTATDYLAAWDFYVSGNSGRIADFATEDNESAALVLRDADGNTTSWLDKSQEADGGYEGKPAAVNWTTDDLGKYYWQINVDASSYYDIVVSSAMLYNYNTYTKQDVQYSIDGETWKNLGSFNLESNKTWYTEEFSLSSDADHQPNVYIRWIADTSSEILGSSGSNDGIAIAEIFIYGTEDIVDDGVAPVLESQVPEEGATNASANGRIVLTFDEKVMVAEGATATIGNLEFTPTASGKTVMVEYKGLEYSTTYTFTMPANTISDLSGNMITEPITITFSTKVKPEITKKLYDFIVPDDGTIQDAIAAAEARSNTSERFYIFVKQGDYIIPASTTATKTSTVDNTTVYADPTTYVSKPNVSIIGEDRDLTTIANTVPSTLISGQNVAEGLGQCETFHFQGNCENMYLQDITIKNSLADGTGRGAALEDEGNKTICKNVCLWGYQDTYYSRHSYRYYFEGGKLRGRTDFLCGRGDIFFNEVELIMCASGGYITAPSIPMKYGYIFRDCTITGASDANTKYYLGRPWNDSGQPICLWINTTMEIQPDAAGWTNMSDDNYPNRFAEYNSKTSSGSTIDLSNRKTSFGSGNHPNDPILTASEASIYTLETVMGGDDGWNPLDYTDQASIPTNVTLFGTTLSWDNSNYVLLWAVCKDGKVVGFTTDPQYTVDDASATYTVRGANEMGGLGEASAAAIVTGINEITTSSGEVVSSAYYNVNGVRVGASYKGIVIKVDTLKDGSKAVTKIINK